MFKVGDLVVFGSYSVCEITSIGSLDMDGISKDRIYYTLKPYYTKGSIIYTPVDNRKEVMRPVLTKDEAIELIDEMQQIDYLWINDERKRERDYKNAMHSCDCRELIKIIKTTYDNKRQRTAHGKTMTSIDKKYFTMAEDYLYGELAIALELPKDEVREYIINRINLL
jgi:CarD family transcriptional regulator